MGLARKLKESHWKESTVGPSVFDGTDITVKDLSRSAFCGSHSFDEP